MRLILLIIVILLVVGALPCWRIFCALSWPSVAPSIYAVL